MITTIQPVVVVMTMQPLLCPTPPPLASTTLVNDGGQGFGDAVFGTYYIAYQSATGLTNILGNFSSDNLAWYPALNSTDPPTHFRLVEKAFNTDCAFYPVVDAYKNMFAMAWLESMPTGRLDLRYISDFTSTPLPEPTPVPNPQPNTNPSGGHTFYVYPRIVTVELHEETENIPMSDITIMDDKGNSFVIDLQQSTSRGLEITLPNEIRKIHWTQKFRMPGRLEGSLTTIPTQQNHFTTSPLIGVSVNLYHGRTKMRAGHTLTDVRGFFSFDIAIAEYTIEVETQTLSINVNERIV